MFQLITLFPLLSGLFVCVCCAVLLVQGIRFPFVFLFGSGALLQVMLRLYVFAVSHVPSGILAATVGYVTLGSTLLYIAGWISLTYVMLRARKASQATARSGV